MAVEYAFSEGNMLIAEAAVTGRELTCAVYYDGKDYVALPVIEILTDNEFFDYEAKYNGHSKEVCPAQIPESLKEEIQETSKKIYAHLGCNGLVRVDYIASEEGLYFLEDLMNLEEGPFVKEQDLVRTSLFNPRMVHSGYGLDMYPTEHLINIAHSGISDTRQQFP